MSTTWNSAIRGKYILGDRVGEGGMGVVHRAQHAALAQTVAIKLLRRELAADPRIAGRFRAEVMAATQLSHPNLVSVLDYGETEDGTPFLVMEYVHGRTLGEIVRAGDELSIVRVVALVRQILAGLGEAHASGVVHADVKSDNVLVERGEDGVERIKLVDFGLARIGRGRRASSDDRILLGTPEYMAPEVIAGEPPTFAADLYGVGVILYELLTGTLPFTGSTAVEVMCGHLENVAVPPSLRRPDRGISTALEELVTRALAKAPHQRPSSAGEFAALLDAAVPQTFANASYPGYGEDERRLRNAISDAIVHGVTDRIARTYLDLAALLVAHHQVHTAILELEEAIDLLTGGEGPSAAKGAVVDLVTALLPLSEQLGDLRVAYAVGPDHWRTMTEIIT